MFCSNCGKEISSDSKFCSNCGATNNNYQANNHPQQHQPDRTEIKQHEETNICAILGIIFAFIMPILGLIFSITGSTKDQYHGLAVAGAFFSIIFIISAIMVMMALLLA